MGKNKPKGMLSVRISPLAQKLIDLERKKTGESEGEVVERCVMHQINHPAAQKLIVRELEKNPSLKPIFDAFLAQVKQQEIKKQCV